MPRKMAESHILKYLIKMSHPVGIPLTIARKTVKAEVKGYWGGYLPYK